MTAAGVRGQVCCLDFGSTFTKAALVDLDAGALVATASVPTTGDTDVMDGHDRCRDRLGVGPDVPSLACSSAGGGLRLAVVGYEREITAEAGHRVGLSAGARVSHVTSGPLDPIGVTDLEEARPDVVLLVGGTDGGNAEVLLHNARRLASSRLRVPFVVAGNADATDEVAAVLERRHKRVVRSRNVLPEIGRLDPAPARAAIRDVFIHHVIGGKGLSRRPEFARMVRAATPDAVLAGVELLADGTAQVEGAGDVLVVDVGGATTDVYSVVTPVGEDAVLRREVVEVMWRSRTVEGDLGMRWNATGIVEAAEAERLLGTAERTTLMPAAQARVGDPAYVASTDGEKDVDTRLAELAITVAVRRHGRGGKDLRDVRLVVGSGGVLRHADTGRRDRMLRPVTADLAGGWPVPERARCVVDESYVLAAAGLLAGDHPDAAARLLRRHLVEAD
ncbi:MAG: hypothetical protein QOJ60_2067 [Actinomycetota bacterium]|nr:hypothetical protein [Actinomycetota bacterium]